VAAAGGTASAEVLEAHCQTHLTKFKQPKSYELVDSLPKTATGKIQRFKLR
jgi:acyl-coenzyme A synthetase/AMP-(fatty) acid ligase